MKRACAVAAVVVVSWGLLACEEVTPTSSDGDLIPLEPRTIELTLPFGDFARGVTTYGGFGTPRDLAESVLAHDFEGELESRVLVRYAPYPWRSTVRDSTGTERADSAFTFVGGRLVARFDTLGGDRPDGPVTVAVGALPSAFDAATASWSAAVDTVGGREPWAEPGAGPVMELGVSEWDPASGDSVVFELDSATVAQLGDTVEAGPGVRFDLRSDGVRLGLLGSDLRVYARPNVNLDTLVTLSAGAAARTFVYDPLPEPEPGGIRVGGAPSWRTVFSLELPSSYPATPDICAQVPCPIELSAERINSATLVLTTVATRPAFQPSDSMLLDAREVLAPDLLPKSPLSSSIVGGTGIPVPTGSFGDEPGETVELPVTPFIGALVDDTIETGVGDLILLTPREPLSIGFGSFAGPGQEGAPLLRIILTVSDTVEVS